MLIVLPADIGLAQSVTIWANCVRRNRRIEKGLFRHRLSGPRVFVVPYPLGVFPLYQEFLVPTCLM